jgi:hypothetical protein
VIRALRLLLLVGVPLTLAVVLWFHPVGAEDENIFEGVREDVDRWLFVHTVFLIFTPLLAFAAYVLMRGLTGTAATVSRVSLVFFLCFYTAYEVTIGLGSGVLVEYADERPASEQVILADAIKHYNQNDILGDPMSVSLALGLLGWVVAMLAAAVAFRKAGAGWPLTVLVALSAFIAIHPPPVGPVALVFFAAAAVLDERRRAREAPAVSSRPIEEVTGAPAAHQV